MELRWSWKASPSRAEHAHRQHHPEDQPLDLDVIDIDDEAVRPGRVEPKLVEVDREGQNLGISGLDGGWAPNVELRVEAGLILSGWLILVPPLLVGRRSQRDPLAVLILQADTQGVVLVGGGVRNPEQHTQTNA